MNAHNLLLAAYYVLYVKWWGGAGKMCTYGCISAKVYVLLAVQK